MANTTPTEPRRNPTPTDNRLTGRVRMARRITWRLGTGATVCGSFYLTVGEWVSEGVSAKLGVEMTQGGSTTGILNKCKEINDGISDISAKRQGQLAAAQNALLDSSTEKEDQTARQTVDYIEDELNNALRYLRDQLKRIKSTPGAGDSRVQKQVDVTTRNLQREVNDYQRWQLDFDKRLREQVRRRYEIANPDATPEELEQGVENVVAGQEQTFQVTGARTRQANDARRAALERSAAIRKIERDLTELAELYQEIGELVHQQEPLVERIDEGAQDVVQNVTQANTQIDGAISSARKARKWKWYILLTVSESASIPFFFFWNDPNE